MGIIDAFGYAHDCHRRNTDNPGNSGDCMEGRIRLLTAITPTYAHAHQSLCLAGRPFDFPHRKFRLPAVKAEYPNLTREKGNDFKGWAVFSDGGTRVSEGETTAGWGAVARSPDGRLYIFFGPIIATEAHLAYARAGLHSNNTAEFSSIIEALSFLGPNGPVARDSQACIFYDSKHAASICLGTIQSRAKVPLGFTCQRLLLQTQLRLRFFCAAHLQSCAESWTCADHAAVLGAHGLVSNQNTLVGSTLPLILLLCLPHVVSLMKPCRCAQKLGGMRFRRLCSQNVAKTRCFGFCSQHF